MKVKKNSLVGIHYRMCLADGSEVDASLPDMPLEFVCGRGDVVPGMERELIGMTPGQSKEFVVAPDDAYGPHDPSLVKELPKAGFPSGAKLEKGQCFSYRSNQGAELRYRVEDIRDDVIVADFNHPLAGRPLHCRVEIVSVHEDSADFARLR